MKKKSSSGVERKVADLIAQFRDGYVSGDMTIEQAEEIVDQLYDFPDEALSQSLALLDASDEEMHLVGLQLLHELDDERAVKPLRRMLRRSQYSDEEKMAIIHVLDELGSPIDDQTFQRVISDPDALMQRSLERLLTTIEDPAQVDGFLHAMEEGPAELQEQYVSEVLAPLGDARLLLLLVALLHADQDSVVLTAIEGLERLKEPMLVPLLEERAEYDPSRTVRHAAGNAALRLRTRFGVSDQDRGEQPPPWIVPMSLPLVYCALSLIDGSGGQVLFLARELPQGNLRVVDWMFNDHEGIKDCFSVIVDEDELQEMEDSFTSLEFVDVELEHARAAVAAAYQTTLDAHRRLPPSSMVWQGWLEGTDPQPPEVFPLPVLEPARQEALLSECGQLLDLDSFEYWFFNPDEVAPFLSEYRRLLRRNQVEPGSKPFEALITRVVEAALSEKYPYRRTMPDRLRRQAWLLRQLYDEQDGTELALWALAAAEAMEAGVIVEHPLLRDMAVYSLNNANT
ncbi:MAG TPA: hypothetical protein ENN99_05785 [Chloroflexi bacterium]|nr:hypothetical protein [Chloroflexota bacterium]